jgi:hypothetical protein
MLKANLADQPRAFLERRRDGHQEREAVVDQRGLFLLIGTVASVLLVLESPSLKVALLLLLTVWAFCRAYFAFYVIEHYSDPGL